MTSVRRIVLPALASALALGGALVSVPAGAATSALPDSIAVVGGSWFRVYSTGELSMGDNEFLQISQSAGGRTVTVRMWDDVEETLGRPLLVGADGCAPAGVPSAEVVCSFATPATDISVDFHIAAGPTNIAVMDNAPLGLSFRGSAGSDYVQGGSANDALVGQGGDDWLFGGAGNDVLDGGPGDDYLEGETGSDDMRGGSGSNSIDAADDIADLRVDCGGPAGPVFDYDKGLDVPTNCGATPPVPVPPAPIEPIDPPVPGQGDGTVDGAPVDVDVAPQGDDTTSVTVNTGPTNPLFQSNLWWFGTPSSPPVPTFPPFPSFELNISNLFPLSVFDLSIFPPPPFAGPVAARSSARQTGPLETVSLEADSNGVARGEIPIPGGLAPGNYTLQFNGVTASGAQMTVNVGVRLDDATPEPDPEPTESITITAKRGKGKQAKTITVRGTTTGLEGAAVTPRYRVQGAKKWTAGKPVTVSSSGTFTWKLSTTKKVRIQVSSGAIKSNGVVVAARKR